MCHKPSCTYFAEEWNATDTGGGRGVGVISQDTIKSIALMNHLMDQWGKEKSKTDTTLLMFLEFLERFILGCICQRKGWRLGTQVDMNRWSRSHHCPPFRLLSSVGYERGKKCVCVGVKYHTEHYRQIERTWSSSLQMFTGPNDDAQRKTSALSLACPLIVPLFDIKVGGSYEQGNTLWFS